MDISDRIRNIRKTFFNDSNIEFAEFMGEKTSTTSGWISGKRGVGRAVIDKITSKLANINPSWLLTGEGSMLKQESVKSDTAIVSTANQEENKELKLRLEIATETIKDKDDIICTLNRRIWELEKILDESGIQYHKKDGTNGF